MAKPATAAQKKRFERICSFGCCICGGIAQVHHAFTGNGGRKDHDKVFPLCMRHHDRQYTTGLHYSRKQFEALHGTEQELLDKTNARLAEIWKD
jgi:hypothetical protein